MALAATVYLSLLGKQGLRQVAELCYHKAHYAATKTAALPGYKLWSEAPFFHEFVLECPISASSLNQHLLDHNIIGGYDLGIDYDSLDHHILIAVTEMNSKEDIDQLVDALEEVTNG